MIAALAWALLRAVPRPDDGPEKLELPDEVGSCCCGLKRLVLGLTVLVLLATVLAEDAGRLLLRRRLKKPRPVPAVPEALLGLVSGREKLRTGSLEDDKGGDVGIGGMGTVGGGARILVLLWLGRGVGLV